MTTPTPVERIVKVLTHPDVGYRPLPTPLLIATVKFDIPAALVGTGPTPDLIVVLDTVQDGESRIRQKVEGIARALDVVRSRRPLTAILVGPRPSINVLDALSRVCRALPVGTALEAEAETSLPNWLAVLLPLRLPELSRGLADPTHELVVRLGRVAEDPIVAGLIAGATQGTEEVEKRFQAMMGESLRQAEPGGNP
jgi:hypothetical protein